MLTEQPILITTVIIPPNFIAVGTVIPKHVFVGPNGTIANTNDPSLGVNSSELIVDSEKVQYSLSVIAEGIAIVKTGAAVSQGIKLQIDGLGRVIPHSSGHYVGASLDSASGADQLIRVLIK